nr:hypothetical protein [Tanacetum cinerariifolium]
AVVAEVSGMTTSGDGGSTADGGDGSGGSGSGDGDKDGGGDGEDDLGLLRDDDGKQVMTMVKMMMEKVIVVVKMMMVTLMEVVDTRWIMVQLSIDRWLLCSLVASGSPFSVDKQRQG